MYANLILNEANKTQQVTSLAAAPSGTSTLSGVPLGTVGDSTTGELAGKVLVRGLKGEAGSVAEIGTSVVTGNFDTIFFIEDTVFASLTSSNITGDSIIGITFPKGSMLYGKISAFQLTSGKVIAYNHA